MSEPTVSQGSGSVHATRPDPRPLIYVCDLHDFVEAGPRAVKYVNVRAHGIGVCGKVFKVNMAKSSGAIAENSALRFVSTLSPLAANSRSNFDLCVKPLSTCVSGLSGFGEPNHMDTYVGGKNC